MAIGDVTILNQYEIGDRSYVIGTVELGDTYPAGGVALADKITPKGAAPVGGVTDYDGIGNLIEVAGGVKFGLTSVDFVSLETVELAETTALVPRYDRVTDSIMLHEGDGPTTLGPLGETDEDVTAATDIRFMAFGTV